MPAHDINERAFDPYLSGALVLIANAHFGEFVGGEEIFERQGQESDWQDQNENKSTEKHGGLPFNI